MPENPEQDATAHWSSYFGAEPFTDDWMAELELDFAIDQVTGSSRGAIHDENFHGDGGPVWAPATRDMPVAIPDQPIGDAEPVVLAQAPQYPIAMSTPEDEAEYGNDRGGMQMPTRNQLLGRDELPVPPNNSEWIDYPDSVLQATVAPPGQMVHIGHLDQWKLINLRDVAELVEQAPVWALAQIGEQLAELCQQEDQNHSGPLIATRVFQYFYRWPWANEHSAAVGY
ncbi:hypothetical protein BDY21DRAFT_367506 [Lineolata rhizophorae]|uniref:Uncharacterized protein n=1 Tax=Lineolata rhizophorae TaxID=578093 RepID=A0A6A6NM96_9PEZI|nr:hypothetical protein BDY21DRAFT_367506 [Lineolata rhizophorae]